MTFCGGKEAKLLKGQREFHDQFYDKFLTGGVMSLMASFSQPVTPNSELMGIVGSVFQIITFSAGALLVLVLFIILWLCFYKPKHPGD